MTDPRFATLSPEIAALLSREFAKPLTHRVTTTYADGKTRIHDTRSLAQAENWSIGESRKIGRNLIDRMTGETVTVVSVTISEI